MKNGTKQKMISPVHPAFVVPMMSIIIMLSGCDSSGESECDPSVAVAIVGLDTAVNRQRVSAMNNNDILTPYAVAADNSTIPIDQFAVSINAAFVRTGDTASARSRVLDWIVPRANADCPPSPNFRSMSTLSAISVTSNNAISEDFPAGVILNDIIRVSASVFAGVPTVDQPNEIFLSPIDSLSSLTAYTLDNEFAPLRFTLLFDVDISEQAAHEFDIVLQLEDGNTFSTTTQSINLETSTRPE